MRLQAGNHIIHVEGLRDSALVFTVDGQPRDYCHGASLVLEEAADVQVNFGRCGSEPYINVMAEKVA